ncbi:MAG: hypothetical protein U0104_12125 [Gemmatimonadales bacterium]
MTQAGLEEQIAQLRAQLTTVDAQLARSVGTPEGLEDLKAAVDNVRTSVWAVLSASRSSNYPGFIARFRLRRGIDILRQIAGDLEAEGPKGLHPEHVEIQVILQQLNEKIGHLRGRGTA